VVHRATVLISIASPLQIPGPIGPHRHCAAAPVCTIQQLASAVA